MNDVFRKSTLPVILLASTVLLSGCATQGKPPPSISLDEPRWRNRFPRHQSPWRWSACPSRWPCRAN